jgi:SpoVK/Ycf46/Vps4 family AAA+-type ATPase
VTAVFTLAYKLQPSIIFIDEVDSFLGQRRVTEHEALTNMKTEFMSLWDGFTTDRKILTPCRMIFIFMKRVDAVFWVMFVARKLSLFPYSTISHTLVVYCG